jgi:prepilin-type N-terminal cleavage/methylation domain-containing protein
MRPTQSRSGLTLVELMIAVAILATLAAVAIPAFVASTRRARTSETFDVLRRLYQASATYYARERFGMGLVAEQTRACTIPLSDNDIVPSPRRQVGDYSDPGFRALEFSHVPSYFRFQVTNRLTPAGRCGVPPQTEVYVLQATGDLDGDGATSLFELTVGSSSENELYHAPAFHIVDETD